MSKKEKGCFPAALISDETGGNQLHSQSEQSSKNQSSDTHTSINAQYQNTDNSSSTTGCFKSVRSKPELFPLVKPYHEAVDGKVLLDSIANKVNLHITCEPQVTYAITLYIVFTWCIEIFDIAPIACITAPEKRCGKTQLAELMGLLCKKSLSTSNISSAALYRIIETFSPTLIIDEVDSFLAGNDELRGILNSGQSRPNAYVIRASGKNFEPEVFNTFCAKIIAGIGHLTSTLRDRSIIMELRRQRQDEVRQRLRHADKAEFKQLSSMLMRWSQDNMSTLASARPALPEVLNDRAQDNWEPLFAIADQIGGHWPKTARQAAIAISGIDKEDPTINEELLAHIRDSFHSMYEKQLSSNLLLGMLNGMKEAPWSTYNNGKPMTARQLADRLKVFNIGPKQIRFVDSNTKGYHIGDFEDAFARYLPDIPVSEETEKQDDNLLKIMMNHL